MLLLLSRKKLGQLQEVNTRMHMYSVIYSSTYVIQVLPVGSRRSINSKSINDADYPFKIQKNATRAFNAKMSTNVSSVA